MTRFAKGSPLGPISYSRFHCQELARHAYGRVGWLAGAPPGLRGLPAPSLPAHAWWLCM